MVRIMSRVVFMCGPSGAGKTTYSKRLEDEGMERLSFSPPYLHVEHHERIPALDPGVEAARLLAYARMSAATPAWELR